MKIIFVYGLCGEEGYSDYRLRLFDPENNGADPAKFAEMWPESIYFEAEVIPS